MQLMQQSKQNKGSIWIAGKDPEFNNPLTQIHEENCVQILNDYPHNFFIFLP
jgi:hypothetical protein